MSLLLLTASAFAFAQKNDQIYDFTVKTIDGAPFSLKALKGKKVMIVNVASKCGLTPQYKQLQELYEEYGGENFVILGFPANNFGSQEPGSNAEIKTFCTANYGVTFPMMEKISVKGNDIAPLYEWLTKKALNGVTDAEVAWNFQKFLIDESGRLVKVIPPKTAPKSVEILEWLNDYMAKTFITANHDTLNYRELLPIGNNTKQQSQKYPLVLFMHGAGERGSDNVAQLTHGSRMYTNPVNREKYPAVVLFPQCPAHYFWSLEKRPEGKLDASIFPSDYQISGILQAVKELVDHYIQSGNVDPDRIYVMGISMGGMATFDLACRFPDTFAAAIPICGGIHPERLKSTVGKVKFRIYHGDKDDVVPAENSRKAYMALKQYGASVEYIEFVGFGHNSWDQAFNQPDFFSWLFAQKKDK
jgi:glutathione peroxidase-family protein/predicted esterase